MQNDFSELSRSTIYRYEKSNLTSQLSAFANFKLEYKQTIKPQKIDQIKKVYPHGLCGRNQHKHLVVVDKIGNIKVQSINKMFEDDELIGYLNQRLIHISQQLLEQKQQIVWVLDLGGKIMQLASKKIVEILIKFIANCQKYFPQMLYKLVFVNTPMLFDTIWNKLTPHISKNTMQKIIMIGDEVQQLYEYADQSCLPDFLGGDIDQDAFLNDCQKVKEKKTESDEQSDEQIDFSSLKAALSNGLKMGGNHLQSVSQTPLNTEADDK